MFNPKSSYRRFQSFLFSDFRFLIFIYVSFLIIGCNEQKQTELFQVEAQLDTTEATIGDIVSFKVITRGVGDRQILFPDLDNAESLDIRNKQILNEKKGVEFQIVFWDTGRFEIPSYSVEVLQADSTVDYTIDTEPLYVTVHSIISGTESRDLRPIKDPVPVSWPLPWREIILGSVFILLLGSSVYLWKRRIPYETIGVETWQFKQPADIQALKRLEALSLPGDVKEFYVKLSHILREFVENSTYVKTLEMTTEEIRSNRSLFTLDDRLMNEWLELLSRADLIKYAKHIPEPGISKTDLEWSKKFVSSAMDRWLFEKLN